MSKPTHILKIRTYPEGLFASVWLLQREGGAVSGLLFGEMLPATADALAAALALPVEREACELEGFTPKPLKQQGLFDAKEQP